MKNKKNLKGFTLVELIIVMAVFGVIMVAVMSIMTPLTRIAKKASIQEANSAAVDNVKHYLESTIRYSDAIEVFVGKLVDDEGNEIDEATAVRNFINNNYSNRTEKGSEDALTGKVRMLRLDNSPTTAGRGHIYESEWDFEAGYTYYELNPDGTFKKEQATDENGQPAFDLSGDPIMQTVMTRVNSTLTPSFSNRSAINEVYYRDYSFYFVPGYNTLEKVTDGNYLTSAGFSDRSEDEFDTFYSKIVPQTAQGGGKYPAFSPSMFSLSVLTYKNNGSVGLHPDDPSTAEDETAIVFRSPSVLSNINMSLVNINSKFSKNNTDRAYGLIRYNNPNPTGEAKKYLPTTMVDLNKEDGKWDYEAISTRQAKYIKDRFHAVTNEGDDIYFIYTMPDMK